MMLPRSPLSPPQVSAREKALPPREKELASLSDEALDAWRAHICVLSKQRKLSFADSIRELVRVAREIAWRQQGGAG